MSFVFSHQTVNMVYVRASFFPFVFRFLTYLLLSCILFLFALRYFVNYVPFYVLYVNFVTVCYLALF